MHTFVMVCIRGHLLHSMKDMPGNELTRLRCLRQQLKDVEAKETQEIKEAKPETKFAKSDLH